MKNLQKLRLLLEDDENSGGSEPEFLNMKPIGKLKKLKFLELLCDRDFFLTFRQVKQFLLETPLKKLKLFCMNFLVESENGGR